MIAYEHFALPNLYLANGYRTFHIGGESVLEFEREEELEDCVRRVLIRNPKRLRGWDLRFLRRGLNLSQKELGVFVARDAQTVARWEKSSEAISEAADLVIRTHFARKFEPSMSVEELLGYVEGSARNLPDRVVFSLSSAGWKFNVDNPVIRASTETNVPMVLELPAIRFDPQSGAITHVIPHGELCNSATIQWPSNPSGTWSESLRDILFAREGRVIASTGVEVVHPQEAIAVNKVPNDKVQIH